MNRLQFNTYLRGELGRRFSVADEEGGGDGTLRLVLVRRGNEEVLVVTTAEGWIRGLQAPPSTEDRVLIKHLAICIRRFFAHPEYLLGKEFVWPGTAQTRSRIRVALDPRKWRRLGAQFPAEEQP
jgi:hypothetical protein